jgi:hypothetical protein
MKVAWRTIALNSIRVGLLLFPIGVWRVTVTSMMTELGFNGQL